jgi:hypothetical protein
MSTYNASKAFVFSFSDSLQAEYQDMQISILCPGIVETDFYSESEMKTPPRNLQLNMMPDQVAKMTYHEFIKGKRVIIPGMINKIGIIFTKLLPRSWITFFIKRVTAV